MICSLIALSPSTFFHRWRHCQLAGIEALAANLPAGAAGSSPKSPQAGAWRDLRPVNLLATVVVRIVPKTIFRAEPSSASLPLASGHPTDPAEGASPFLAPAVRVPGPWFSPRSAHGRRMMGLRGCWPSNVVHAVCEQPQPDQRNGRTHVPAGTSRRIRRTNANRWIVRSPQLVERPAP